MPASIRRKHSNPARTVAKATNARVVAREVVARLEQLAPMAPKTVASAFRDALPVRQRRSAEIIEIAKLIARLGPVRRRSTSGPSAKDAVAADPLAIEAMNERSALLRARRIVSSKDMCESLDFSRQALSKAVKDQRMFTVAIGHDRFYPAFFADAELDRHQLESVARELGDLPGWSKWQFFTTPKASLDGATPLEALKNGRYNEARRAAVGFADR